MAALTIAVLWFVQVVLLRDSYVDSKLETVEQALLSGIDTTEKITAFEEKTSAALLIFDNERNLEYRSQGLPMMGMMQRVVSDMLPLENRRLEYIETAHAAVFSLADTDEAARLLRQQLWLMTALLLILAAIISAWLSTRFSKPIRAVTSATGELADGNYDVKLSIESADEIGRMTEALNHLADRLKSNDRLQRELIANVSHELKAPLTIIRGYTETVRDVSWQDERRRNKHLELIISETDRLKLIVQDILDYSQLQAGTIKLKQDKFELRPLIEAMADKLTQAAQQRDLTISIDGDDQTIVFDRKRLEQVCFNLMLNAIQYAAPATEIRIALNKHSGTGSRRLVRLTVSNEGHTIPPEELTKIWDRYHRAESISADNVVGTGLGLAIVKSILEQNKTAYGVESQAGLTTFWLDLLVI
jgi:signal transduction histidine kinase